MDPRGAELYLVEDRERVDRAALDDDPGDLALTLSILVVGLVPLAGELAHLGSWSPASLGLGTGGALLALGALWSQLVARRAHRG